MRPLYGSVGERAGTAQAPTLIRDGADNEVTRPLRPGHAVNSWLLLRQLVVHALYVPVHAQKVGIRSNDACRVSLCPGLVEDGSGKRV